jgi:hypothetical protein
MTSDWYPLCYPSKKDYLSWVTLRNHAQEVVNICDDCTKNYMELMQGQNRCDPATAQKLTTNSKKYDRLFQNLHRN